jgi:hypothetical protein
VSAVYGTLGLDVDAAVAGALDEVLPGVTPGEVAGAIADAYAPHRTHAVTDELVRAAEALRARHAVPSR